MTKNFAEKRTMLRISCLEFRFWHRFIVYEILQCFWCAIDVMDCFVLRLIKWRQQLCVWWIETRVFLVILAAHRHINIDIDLLRSIDWTNIQAGYYWRNDCVTNLMSTMFGAQCAVGLAFLKLQFRFHYSMQWLKFMCTERGERRNEKKNRLHTWKVVQMITFGMWICVFMCSTTKCSLFDFLQAATLLNARYTCYASLRILYLCCHKITYFLLFCFFFTSKT